MEQASKRQTGFQNTMRTNWLMLLTMLLGVAVIGCGPRIDDDELGTILYKIPDVPGAEKRVIVEPWPDEDEKDKQEAAAAR
jgi:hypothetical protein